MKGAEPKSYCLWEYHSCSFLNFLFSLITGGQGQFYFVKEFFIVGDTIRFTVFDKNN